MQFDAEPDWPDPLYAKRLQEVAGGKFGEVTVMDDVASLHLPELLARHAADLTGRAEPGRGPGNPGQRGQEGPHAGAKNA